MTEGIRVTCLLNRYWDPATLDYGGEECIGTIIDISTEETKNEPGRLIPVGIVLLDDGAFQCVPMEFIRRLS